MSKRNLFFRPQVESLEDRYLLSAVVPALAPAARAGPAALVSLPSQPATAAPVIQSLGGYTSFDAGISNGLVAMTAGTTWNGSRVVNDQPGLYTWTIQGSGFGAQTGQVILAGRSVPARRTQPSLPPETTTLPSPLTATSPTQPLWRSRG